MPRSGLLAALLICSPPAWTAPHVLAALDTRTDTTHLIGSAPDLHGTLPRPGMSVTWERLLNPGDVVPAQDVCDSLVKGAFPGDMHPPVDPAQILSALKRQGVCSGAPG